MTPDARRRILLNSLLYTMIGCTIVSCTIMLLYDRADWPWELAISNVLTIVLTMSMTFFIGTKLEHIRALTHELRRLVERDRLTDVATRDFFFDRLEMDRQAYGVSLMVDIDHFKRVNDAHGHLAGDDVIANVARVLRAQVGERDIVCRFGGEEFVVFLHEASGQDGWAIAERMRGEIERATTQTREGPIQVTVSVGGSLKQQVEDIEDAIRRADQCLYRAKEMGRNRTQVDWDIKTRDVA